MSARPGDYDRPPLNFPELPRCDAPLEAPVMWPGVVGGCCREAGHGGPHHYRLGDPA